MNRIHLRMPRRLLILGGVLMLATLLMVAALPAPALGVSLEGVDPVGGETTVACCLPGGTCQELTEAACLTAGGTAYTDGRDCSTIQCDLGACWLPDGSCAQLSATACALQSGNWQGLGVACAAIAPTGACCLPDGSCATLSQAQCVLQSGTYQGNNVACATANCAVGACVLPSGTCSVMGEAACQVALGTYLGDGTDCGILTQTGACCLPNETCTVTTTLACLDVGGTYQGAGTDCAGVNCVPPTGACCLPGGSCASLTENACDALYGAWQGADTNCGSAGCQPMPTGACWLGSFTPDDPRRCELLPETACLAQQGTYQGDGSGCEGLPGSIISLTATSSLRYIPTDGPVTIRATVLNLSPQAVDLAAIAAHIPGAPGAVFDCLMPQRLEAGESRVCQIVTPIGGTPGALISGSVVVTATNGATGIYPVEAPLTLPPLGACCLPDGTCESLTQAACAASYGDWGGADTQCSAANCQPMPTGGCWLGAYDLDDPRRCETVSENECLARYGAYQGDGSACTLLSGSPLTMTLLASPCWIPFEGGPVTITAEIRNVGFEVADVLAITATLPGAPGATLACALPNRLDPGDNLVCQIVTPISGSPGDIIAGSVRMLALVGGDKAFQLDAPMDTDDIRLVVSKTDRQDPWYAGWNLGYDIRVLNTGCTTLTQVVVTDTVPLPWANVLGGSTEVTQTVWNLGTLSPGAARDLEITIQTRRSIPDQTILTNRVEVMAAELTAPITTTEGTLFLAGPTPAVTPVYTATPPLVPTRHDRLRLPLIVQR